MEKNKDLKLHLKFHDGNVVKWDGDVYIVAEVLTDSLVLLPWDMDNVRCHPSTTWPKKRVYDCDPAECGYDPASAQGHTDDCLYHDEVDTTKTVDTIKVIAPNVKALITQTLVKTSKLLTDL